MREFAYRVPRRSTRLSRLSQRSSLWSEHFIVWGFEMNAVKLNAACAAVWLAIGVVGAESMAGSGLRRQAPESVTFEVAAIRPNRPDGIGPLGGVKTSPGGSVTASGVTVRTLIGFAYGLDLLFETVEGKSAILTSTFDVVAKAGGETPSVPTGQVGPLNIMMQNLLAERFKLVVHWERRELNGFALVLLRPNGPLGRGLVASDKCSREFISQSNDQSAQPRRCFITVVNNEMTALGTEMRYLAKSLATETRQPVIDRTGLDGFFDIKMTYDQLAAMESAGRRVPSANDGDRGLPLLPLALQEQLGLRLQPERVPVRVLIVDQIEAPSPN